MSIKKTESDLAHSLFFQPARDDQQQHPVEGAASFSAVYQKEKNVLYEGNSLEWLKCIESETVDLVFADPPYNIKKADWDKFQSQEEYIQW